MVTIITIMDLIVYFACIRIILCYALFEKRYYFYVL